MSTPLTEKAAEELWRDCIAKGSASLLSYRVTKLLVSVDRAARSEDSQDMGALAVLRLTRDALVSADLEMYCGENQMGTAERPKYEALGHWCGSCDQYVDRNGPVRAQIKAAIAKADALLSRSGVRPSAPAPSMEFEGHTPGPWSWRFCVGGRPELVHPKRGLLLVMDAVRDGMQRATLRFAKRNPSDVGGIMFKAEHFLQEPGRDVADYQVPQHPDMRLIAAAPAIPSLLSALLPIAAAYPDDPNTSDLDDEQPVTITLGDVRRARAALREVERSR